MKKPKTGTIVNFISLSVELNNQVKHRAIETGETKKEYIVQAVKERLEREKS
jgi:hypothetical protein